jgi:neuroligin
MSLCIGFMKPGLNDQTVANFGLLDIIAALQWIKENIEAFGGNKNLVTLLGYDHGAILANFLMISPVAKGLFHRTILMSGSALADWALNYNPQKITLQVAKKLNCPIEDAQLGDCLRKKPYREILNVSVTAPEFTTIFGPIVDGLVVPSDPHQGIYCLIAYDRASNLPLLIDIYACYVAPQLWRTVKHLANLIYFLA